MRPDDPGLFVLEAFIMTALKMCQQVCQNLWSGLIQHMSNRDILPRYL